MKSWVRTILYFLAVILITASVTAGVTVTLLNQKREDVVVLSAEEYAEISDLLFLDEMIDRVQNDSFQEPPAREALLDAAARGIVAALDDPYAAYYTAEEYEDYVAQQREGMAQLVAEGARAWTNQDGWFVWTQEKMDEVMAIYEQTLSEIRQGTHVSKTVNGSDDVVIHESLSGDKSLSLSLDETHTSVYIQSDGGEAE